MAALARRNRRRGAQFRALERKSLAKGESGVAGNSSNGSGSGRAINRVFTRGVITDLVERGRSEVFDAVARSCISDPEGKTHGQIISEIYARLGREHRNEYYYMNTLLNRLLAGARGASSAAALSQVPVGRHVADFVMIGGEVRGEGQSEGQSEGRSAGQSDGRVYEIKSDLDNCDRLRGQLCGFYRAFSK
ncbi:MAG: hypothetical protein LBL83_05635, partial [Clostridiales bacterium]|nr:hypothetical protein [Clostridiales bacterium]